MTTEMVKVEQPATDTIQISDYDVSVKEYKGERVVTFKDIDTVHERVDGTASRNFRKNKEHFIDGVDFFKITPNEFRRAFGENSMDKRQSNDITLLTESGYLMLAKSLTDKKAWKVQRQLVNTYFRVKQVVSDNLILAEKNAQLEAKVDKMGKTLQVAVGLLTAKPEPDMKSIKSWKNKIATPLMMTLSDLSHKPISDCYKMIYRSMFEEYGFYESAVLSRFEHDYDCIYCSTINAIANNPVYCAWFTQTARKLIRLLSVGTLNNFDVTTVQTDIVQADTDCKAEVNPNTTSALDVIDIPSVSIKKFTIKDNVQDVINNVAEIIGDKSKNKNPTMRKIYSQITTRLGWKQLLTRNRCSSKKELIAKVDKYHRKFIRVCNNMVS